VTTLTTLVPHRPETIIPVVCPSGEDMVWRAGVVGPGTDGGGEPVDGWYAGKPARSVGEAPDTVKLITKYR
jgi:hypothetical protein